MAPAVKTCTGCGATKPVDEFHRFVRSKDGRTPRCKPCVSEANMRYREKHRDQVLAGKKAAYYRDPAANMAKNRAWRARNPDRHQYLVRKSWLKQIYNITHADYDQILDAQGGVCAICGNPPKRRRLALDHDHSCCPGKRSCGKCIRGILCFTCNRQMGWHDASRAVVEAYLARYRASRDGVA